MLFELDRTEATNLHGNVKTEKTINNEQTRLADAPSMFSTQTLVCSVQVHPRATGQRVYACVLIRGLS